MNRSQLPISPPLLYCLSLIALLVLSFELWRLILVLFSWDTVSQVPLPTLLKSFIIGLRFDMVVASYIMLPLTLIAIIPGWNIQSSQRSRKIHTFLLVLMGALAFFGHLADIEFYDYYDLRLNGAALHWIDTPGTMVSFMWETYPVFWYALLYGVILYLFYRSIKWLQKLILNKRKSVAYFWHLVALLPCLLILFFGARGRLAFKTPIRWGVAYFSQYDAANKITLNPVYTFIHDAIYTADQKADLKDYVEGFKRNNAEQVVRELLGVEAAKEDGSNERIYRKVTFDPPNQNPPNVILIVMESFGATKIDVLENKFDLKLSPCFDSISADGTLFTNYYSEGMHTYSGVFSSLFGYPHLMGKLIMKQAEGEFHLNGLPGILRENNYRTIFALPHDPHFDNMQGFMIANGFQRVISSLDFTSDEQISTWGVPDHVLFDRVLEEARKLKDERFFFTVLSASNHGPWIVPDVPFERVSEGTKDEEILNAFKYSDWALGRFIRSIQNDPAFDNTLIVISSDNGAGGIKRMDLDLSYFHSPLLLLDTRDIIEKGARKNRLASQMDILSTIMGRLKLDYVDYSFGHDLLKEDTSIVEFAYLSEWYRMGYIENGYYGVSRQRGRGPVSIYRLPDLTVDLADSLPDLAAEYSEKVQSIFQTGYYNLFKPLLSDSVKNLP